MHVKKNFDVFVFSFSASLGTYAILTNMAPCIGLPLFLLYLNDPADAMVDESPYGLSVIVKCKSQFDTDLLGISTNEDQFRSCIGDVSGSTLRMLSRYFLAFSIVSLSILTFVEFQASYFWHV